MCAHVHDVALCDNTVRNVALGFWLVGQSLWIKCNSWSHITWIIR